MVERLSLGAAVERHVRPGDTVHVAMGHHRWTALARETCRQFWGGDAGIELVMGSLGSLGVLFFRGGLLRKVVTAYSGDAFPTYAPNPVFTRAYAAGEVEVEHWSFLTLRRRLAAAAQGLPAVTTRPLGRTSFAANPAYSEVETAAGPVGLLAPLVPDVTLLHAVLADEAGNLACAPPGLDGVDGAWAARRGCVATVERVVDDLSAFAGLVRIPAHRVLAVVEAPFGAHPGGVYGAPLRQPGYAEDTDAWVEARRAARGDLDAWARATCLDVATHEDYLAAVGPDRLQRLLTRLHPAPGPPPEPAPDVRPEATAWEAAATYAAREVSARTLALRADGVLAGAGVANLAAWVGVAAARAAGSPVRLTAELGLWGYTPTPGSPFIFEFRSFPSAELLGDAETVLGLLVGGPGTVVLGCLGAAEVDDRGDVNSTLLAGGRPLVGAGGGTDVAVGADEVVVVTLLRPERTPRRVAYVTAPGDRVTAVVTDRGLLRRRDGRLRLAAVPAGANPLAERVRTAVASCGWDLEVDREVSELAAPEAPELAALRRYDPQGFFLR